MKNYFNKTLLLLSVIGLSTTALAQSSSDNAYINPADYASIELNGANKNQNFCDDFNVANTTTLTGWTEQSGDWEVLDNRLYHASGTNHILTVDGSDAVDGILTATALYEDPGLQYLGLIGRHNASGQHILFKLQDNNNSGFFDKYFVYIPGTASLSNDGNYGLNPIFQLEYVGADITIRIDSDRDGNWDEVNTTTTTYLDSGLMGLEAYSKVSADDFCTGPIAPPAPAVPVSGWGIIIALLAIGGFGIFRKLF